MSVIRSRTGLALAVTIVTLAAPRPTMGQDFSPRLNALLAKLPPESQGKPPAEGGDISRELLELDAADIRALCGALTGPIVDGYEPTRRVLHALALLLSGSEHDAQRNRFVRTVARVLYGAPPPRDEAFLLNLLRIVGTQDDAVELPERLESDADCEDAVATALCMSGESAADTLRQALPESRDDCRIAIVNALGVLRDDASVSSLMDLATGASEPVRLAALYALARIGEPRAVRPLRDATTTGSWYQRSRATDCLLVFAERLAEGGYRDETAALLNELYATRTSPSDTYVRCAALYGMGRALKRAAAPVLVAALLDENPQVRNAAANAAVALPGQKSTRDMLAGFYRAPPRLQVALLEVMARRGDRLALSTAVRALELPDAEVRAAAATAIAALGSGRVALRLVPLLGDEDSRVVSATRAALVRMPGQLTTEWLVGALAELPSPQRALLLHVLAQRPAPTDLEAIVKAAQDADADVRVAALRALTVHAGEKELPALLSLLAKAKSDEERVAASATVSAVCGRCENVALAAAHVIRALNEPNATIETRCELLSVLGRLEDEHARAALQSALADDEPRIQAVAKRALSGQSE